MTERDPKKTGNYLVNPRKAFVIHEDNIVALQEYRKGNKQAFKEMVEKRNALAEEGIPYWNTDHDAEMVEWAKERTDNAVIRGWKFPTVKRRKK